MQKSIILTFALLLTTVVGFSQQYGHLNFGSLLSVMPATKAADSQLESFQNQLVAQGEKKVAEFQAEYQAFATKLQNGTLSPQQQAKEEQRLQQMQQEVVAIEGQIGQQVAQKRNQLLAPIVEKAQNAIDAVAKERGYLMIFDTSVFNSVLYAGEAEDAMPFVLAKLGL